MTKIRSQGFSVVEAVIILLVLAAIGAAGGYAWYTHHKPAPTKQAETTTPAPSSTEPAPADSGNATLSQVQMKARDVERKTDINSLAVHAEAYFADSSYYPTLANINDPAWRAANMKGLDEDALRDPSGSSFALTASLQSNAYAYVAAPSGCDNIHVNCTDYTLTAKLEAGGIYQKSSLN